MPASIIVGISYLASLVKRGTSAGVNTARNARKITSAAVNIFVDVSDD